MVINQYIISAVCTIPLPCHCLRRNDIAFDLGLVASVAQAHTLNNSGWRISHARFTIDDHLQYGVSII